MVWEQCLPRAGRNFNISFLLCSIMPVCSHKSSLRCVQWLRPFCWFNTRFIWPKLSVFSSRLLQPCQSVSLVSYLPIKKWLDYCTYNTSPPSQTTQSMFVAFNVFLLFIPMTWKTKQNPTQSTLLTDSDLQWGTNRSGAILINSLLFPLCGTKCWVVMYSQCISCE